MFLVWSFVWFVVWWVFSGQVAYPDLVRVLVWLIWGAVIKWGENHRGEYTMMRSG